MASELELTCGWQHESFRLIRGEKAENAVLPAAVVARESTGNTVI